MIKQSGRKILPLLLYNFQIDVEFKEKLIYNVI